MQTCSKCNALSADNATQCINCGAELSEFSTTAIARKNYQANLRVKVVRVIVSENACPACRQVEGTYQKESITPLPVEGCSHENGCRCSYEPYLTEIFP